jgi:transposase
VGIVALALKLAIALWRFVEDGLVPTSARLETEYFRIRPPSGDR